MLITNQNSIYYNGNELTNEGDHCAQRESDLSNFESLYPEITFVTHGLDGLEILKLMQKIDGCGPFTYDVGTETDDDFFETGEPLTAIKWYDEKVKSFTK